MLIACSQSVAQRRQLRFALWLVLVCLLSGHRAFASLPNQGVDELDRARGLPSLSVVLEQARRRAPQIQVGRTALAVSRTELVNARRVPIGNPNVELLGQRGTSGATRGVAWGGTMWLPFELSGQRASRVAEAQAFASLSDANLEMVEALVLGEAYSAYGAVQVEAERILIVEQLVALATKAAEIYDARLRSGDGVKRDAAMAKVELARNQVLLQDAKRRLAGALTTLNRVTGEAYRVVRPPVVGMPDVKFDRYMAKIRQQVPPAVSASDSEAEYFENQKGRLESESTGPVSLMLMGGRGDLGEARVGVGVAYELPLLRSLQGERARAASEVLRATVRRDVTRGLITRQIEGIADQYAFGKQAYELLTDVALPAANQAVTFSTETLEAGKTEWPSVLLSRRDLAMLSLERLNVAAQQWSLVGQLIQLTGELP